MLYVCVLVIGFMLLFYVTQLRPARYTTLVSRPIMRPARLVNHLYALDWTAQQFEVEALRLAVRGDSAAIYYADFAHIRALEQRLENERFAQLARLAQLRRQRRPIVRALARVRAV